MDGTDELPGTFAPQCHLAAQLSTQTNAYVESFNGRLRDECLNANWFTSLNDAKRKIEEWRQDYNQQRPHSSLAYLSPAAFALTRAEMRA
jgi:putative transposase